MQVWSRRGSGRSSVGVFSLQERKWAGLCGCVLIYSFRSSQPRRKTPSRPPHHSPPPLLSLRLRNCWFLVTHILTNCRTVAGLPEDTTPSPVSPSLPCSPYMCLHPTPAVQHQAQTLTWLSVVFVTAEVKLPEDQAFPFGGDSAWEYGVLGNR